MNWDINCLDRLEVKELPGLLRALAVTQLSSAPNFSTRPIISIKSSRPPFNSRPPWPRFLSRFAR